MCEQSQLMVVQDVWELAGALVYDCRPPLLPVSIPLRDLRRSSADRPLAPSGLSALPTRDQFLPYTVSPEHELCAPVVSPVMMDLPTTPSFPSPGSPAAMDRILAGDVDLLMDNKSDLPSLPSSLLPVPSPRVLPPEPPVVP